MVAQIDWTRVFQLLTIVFIVEFSIHPVIGGCPFGHGKEHASHGEGIQEVQRHTSHVHTHDHQAEHSHHGHKHNHVGHSHIHEHKHAHDHEVSRGAVDSSRLRPAEEIAEERELLLGKDYDHFDDYDHFYETGQGGDLVPPGIWLRAMGSSLIVSLASLICLILLPFICSNGKMPARWVVDTLAAFGVGAMLGDAFLHQLPHAFGSGGAHNHDHNHSHAESHGHDSHGSFSGHGEDGRGHAHSIQDLSVGLAVLFGILLFFIVEKIVRRVEEVSARGKEVPFASHAHHHHHISSSNADKPVDDKEDSDEFKAEEVEEKADVTPEVPQLMYEGEGTEKEEDLDGTVIEKEGLDGTVIEKEEDLDGTVIEREEAKEAEVLAELEGEETKSDLAGVQRSGEPEGDWQKVELAQESESSPLLSGSSKEPKHDSSLRQRKKATSREEEPVVDAEDTKKEQGLVPVPEKEEASRSAGAPEGDSSHLVLGYLNLFSDGVHNFTDGMALGAAFLHHGNLAGWSRMLFMLAHEIPQEVGDFGILVRSGLTVFKALALNFLSALMAVAGTAMVLTFGGSEGTSSVIEGFTAGGFIYIAVAGVIPAMHSRGSHLGTTTLQLLAMTSGMAIAVVISLME